MKNSKCICILISIIMISLGGCVVPNNSNTSRVTDESPMSRRPTVSEAKKRMLSAYPGIPPSRIIELLGDPDESSAGTYGTKTDAPWQGITWVYRWRSFSGDAQRLSIMLGQKDNGDWFVNSWAWYDF